MKGTQHYQLMLQAAKGIDHSDGIKEAFRVHARLMAPRGHEVTQGPAVFRALAPQPVATLRLRGFRPAPPFLEAPDRTAFEVLKRADLVLNSFKLLIF